MSNKKKFIDYIQNRINEITFKSIGKTINKNINYNQNYLKFGQSIKKLKNENFGKRKIAIVVGAGPSIKQADQTKILKKYQNKAIIIACDGSLYYLLRNKIFPDLVVTLDPHPTRVVRWFGDENLNFSKMKKDDYYRRQDLDTDFRKEMLTNKKNLKLTQNFGKNLNIATCTSSSKAVVKRLVNIKSNIYWWNPYVDDPSNKNSISRKIFMKNKLPLINTGGNVGSAAWMIAEGVLNCKKIALMGMDFAYYLNTNLANTQYYDLLKKSFDRRDIKKFFKKIYNPYLKKYFYADHVYLWYKKCFLEMLSISNSITYNCTGGGILFEKPLKLTNLKLFCSRYLN